MDDKIKIRIADIKDAEWIVSLAYEFGYRPTIEEIKNRIIKYSKRNNEEIYVAEYDNVLGWIHVSLVEPLQSKPFAEIRGLVVKEEFRGKGIGTKLIVSAENWAKNNGCNKIRIRTNIKRVETAEYYRRLGLISVKTQKVFEKVI